MHIKPPMDYSYYSSASFLCFPFQCLLSHFLNLSCLSLPGLTVPLFALPLY